MRSLHTASLCMTTPKSHNSHVFKTSGTWTSSKMICSVCKTLKILQNWQEKEKKILPTVAAEERRAGRRNVITWRLLLLHIAQKKQQTCSCLQQLLCSSPLRSVCLGCGPDASFFFFHHHVPFVVSVTPTRRGEHMEEGEPYLDFSFVCLVCFHTAVLLDFFLLNIFSLYTSQMGFFFFPRICISARMHFNPHCTSVWSHLISNAYLICSLHILKKNISL